MHLVREHFWKEAMGTVWWREAHSFKQIDLLKWRKVHGELELW